MESDKNSAKKYTFFVVVGILLATLLIAGGTYAYLFYGVNVTNKNIVAGTTCFDVIYDADNDSTPINGRLLPSSGPAGGLSGMVSIGMEANCNIDSYGNFYLNVTTGSDILFQTVAPHCENSQTLKTLVGYTDRSSCENQTNGKWVTRGTALKYAIYTTDAVTSTTVPIKVGYINSLGKLSLYSNFSLLHQSIDYYVYIWLDGNLSDNSYANQSIVGDVSATVSQVHLDASLPTLDTGLIPVKISNDGTVTTVSENDSSWYDYSNKEWANAILVKENGTNSRSYYSNNIGVTVTSSDILAYYVWIPRYKYKIWTTTASAQGKEQTIDIMFESEGDSIVNGTQVGDYRTHSAFWWDNDNDGTVDSGEMLAGIWVGKFETTGDATTPTILPNAVSLRNMNGSTQFVTALKFAGGVLNGGSVIFSGSDTYGLGNTVDSHMMKSIEWGAVAYLSHSQYGINKEIRLNNNSNHVTGCGASEEKGASTSECQIAFGGASSYPQSTTGNITGIFDMSGGSWDNTMGYYIGANSNYASNPNSYFGWTSTVNSTGYSSLLDSKYWDAFETNNIYTACNGGPCYGYALYETANWYGNFFHGISNVYPWDCYGGTNDRGAGIFSRTNSTLSGSDSGAYRSVIILN